MTAEICHYAQMVGEFRYISVILERLPNARTTLTQRATSTNPRGLTASVLLDGTAIAAIAVKRFKSPFWRVGFAVRRLSQISKGAPEGTLTLIM
jgi:hypothetical protein